MSLPAASDTQASARVASRSWRMLGWLLGLAPLVALLTSPWRWVYDEVYYLGIALRDLRADPDVLDHLKNNWRLVPGPLHAFIHWATSFWMECQPIPARVVNAAMYYTMLWCLWKLLRTEKMNSQEAGLTALLSLSVPPAWVIAGVALTEMPAMLCVTVAFYFVVRASRAGEVRGEASHSPTLPVGWCVAGGLFAGLAVTGRQPYLLMIPLFAGLLWWRGERRGALLFLAASSVLPAVLFLFWGGLTSVSTRYSNVGIRWEHGLLGMAYMGLFLALLCPRWLLGIPWRVALGMVVLAVGFNQFVLGFRRAFLATLAEKYVPLSADAWSLLGGHACCAVAVVSGVALIMHCWERRRDSLYIAAAMSAFSMVGISAAISHIFSSRYPAMALPFLVVMSTRHRRWDRLELGTAAAGALLGLLSLLTYYHLTPMRLSDFPLPAAMGTSAGG